MAHKVHLAIWKAFPAYNFWVMVWNYAVTTEEKSTVFNSDWRRGRSSLIIFPFCVLHACSLQIIISRNVLVHIICVAHALCWLWSHIFLGPLVAHSTFYPFFPLMITVWKQLTPTTTDTAKFMLQTVKLHCLSTMQLLFFKLKQHVHIPFGEQ